VLQAAEGRRLAALLEKAAAIAMEAGPDKQGVGACRGFTIGVLRQRDGMGWVSLDWAGEAPSITCLGPGDAGHLAESLRIAAQPGANLEAAQQSWWREQERLAATAPGAEEH
jgi:hypothetical protein